MLKEEQYQGLEYNIKKFEKIVPDVVKDLKKLRGEKAQNAYRIMLGSKFLAATIIPIALIGFILPKMIFASSAKKLKNFAEQNKINKMHRPGQPYQQAEAPPLQAI